MSASTSLHSEVRKPKCCSCNGINARCKSCVCVKANRSCTNCQPIKRGGCANSNRSAALSPSPSRHLESTSAASVCSRPLSPGTVASPVISYSQPLSQSPIYSALQPQTRVSPQPPSPSLQVSLSSANLSLPPVLISDPPQPISTSPHCGNPLPVSSNLPVLGQKDRLFQMTRTLAHSLPPCSLPYRHSIKTLQHADHLAQFWVAKHALLPRCGTRTCNNMRMASL